MSNYLNPVIIVNTDDWLSSMQSKMHHLKINNPLIVTSNGNNERLSLKKIFNDTSVFSNAKDNPTFDDSINIIRFIDNKDFDGVIAIGGGSVMDLAKLAMAHLAIKNKNVLKLINFKKKYKKRIPSIFIPTTHGTASEVTMWGTIWDMKKRKKHSISNFSLYPDFAILDASLTLSLPLNLSIITAMDALSHSLEAIWNKNHNIKSTDYALDAICLIIENVNKLKIDSQNIKTRKNLLIASTTAGLAFSNTKTAAAHSISYPLTANFGIPHGIASSLTLVPLLEINKKHIKQPLMKICRRLNMTLDDFKNEITNIPKNVIPFSLKSLNVPKNMIDLLVNESFTKGRMDNNIVDLCKEDVNDILQSVYD